MRQDYGGLLSGRILFCFVLFWGNTLRLKQIKNGRNGRILATLGGLGYFGWPGILAKMGGWDILVGPGALATMVGLGYFDWKGILAKIGWLGFSGK